MRRIPRWLAIAVVVSVVVLVGLSFLINANRFKPVLESELTSALNREVKLGNLKLSIFSGGIAADDVSIADDPAFGKSPFVRAKSLRAEVALLPFLFSRKLNVTGITIDRPEIMLLQNPAGDWNFSSLGTKSGAKPARTSSPSVTGDLDLSVKLLQITGGRLTLGRTSGHWRPIVLEDMNMGARDFSKASAFPFSFSTKIAGGGSLKLDGKAGPLNQTDASMIPVSARLSLTDLDLARSRLNDFAPDVAGVISFDGSADANGTTAQVSGKLTGEKMKLEKNGTPANVPLALDFAAEHNLRKHSGVLSRGDIRVGKAPASLAGTYFEQGDSINLKMNLSGSNMPVSELVNILPALGIVLPTGSSLQGGTLTVKMSLEGPADKLVTSGSVMMSNTRLASFDLGKKMSAIQRLAGIPAGRDTEIQSASANVRMASGGVTAEDIKLIVPGIGELRGGGNVSPANALAFKMSATVRATGLPAVLGNTAIPFVVEGTASDPIFKPDIETLARGQLKNFQADPAKAASEILKGFLNKKKQ